MTSVAFGEGQTLRRLCDYLGIYDQLRLKDVDETMDEIFMASTGDCYEIRGNREGFVQSWARYFPQEETGIARYVDASTASPTNSLFHLHPPTRWQHRAKIALSQPMNLSRNT